MLSILDSNSSQNAPELSVYRDRVNYLDKQLTQLEVDHTPLPLSIIPPTVVHFILFLFSCIDIF
jgi:hypothetical protein